MTTTLEEKKEADRKVISVGWTQNQLEKRAMKAKVEDLVLDKRILRQKIKKPNGQLKGYLVAFPDSLVIGENGIRTICVGFSLIHKGDRNDMYHGYDTAIKRAWRHRNTRWIKINENVQIPMEILVEAGKNKFSIPMIDVYGSIAYEIMDFISRAERYFGKNGEVQFPEWVDTLNEYLVRKAIEKEKEKQSKKS